MLAKDVFLWENSRLDSKILKWILHSFTEQINPISLRSWCIKETEKSLPRVDYSVPLMEHNPSDLELICLVKKCKIHFWI